MSSTSSLFLMFGNAGNSILAIDWTIVPQFAFFLAMYFILKNWVFQPYLKVRDQRKAKMEGTQKEADLLAEQTRQLEKEYKQQFEKARASVEEERLKLYTETQAQEQKLLAEARSQLQRQVEEAQSQIQAQMEQAKKDLDEKVESLASHAASRLLGREVTS